MKLFGIKGPSILNTCLVCPDQMPLVSDLVLSCIAMAKCAWYMHGHGRP